MVLLTIQYDSYPDSVLKRPMDRITCKTLECVLRHLSAFRIVKEQVALAMRRCSSNKLLATSYKMVLCFTCGLLLVASSFLFGGARRDRTADPLLAKQVLSQLSYGPCFNWGQTTISVIA
jgi:hypothetical protein